MALTVKLFQRISVLHIARECKTKCQEKMNIKNAMTSARNERLSHPNK